MANCTDYQQRLIDARRASAFVGHIAAVKWKGVQVLIVAPSSEELETVMVDGVGCTDFDPFRTFKVCVVRESETAHNMDKVTL